MLASHLAARARVSFYASLRRYFIDAGHIRISSLDFRQLRYALSVYKERSFTGAAKRLNISQSAVSEQVKLLEEEIGFELFLRTSRGIEATDRGRTFLYESERVMGALLSLSDTGRLVAEPIIMSELTVGYGQVVLSLFTDLGIKPNILAVVDNIETIKMIVQSEGGIAIVPRACAENEVALGLLKAFSIAPARNVVFSLFRRREPLSRRKESALLRLRDMLKA